MNKPRRQVRRLLQQLQPLPSATRTAPGIIACMPPHMSMPQRADVMHLLLTSAANAEADKLHRMTRRYTMTLHGARWYKEHKRQQSPIIDPSDAAAASIIRPDVKLIVAPPSSVILVPSI